MIEVEATLRQWGRSLGVVIPKEAVDKLNLAEDDEVEIFVRRKSASLRNIFGKAPLKKTTKQLLKEVRRDSWNV